ADSCGGSQECLSDHRRPLPARCVIVGDNDYIAPAQRVGVLRQPKGVRSARVCGCNESMRPKRLNILLPLNDEYDWCLQNLPQTIEHLMRMFAPDPLAMATRVPLAKGFWRVSNYLVQQVSVRVGVVVRVNNPLRNVPGWRFPETTSF